MLQLLIQSIFTWDDTRSDFVYKETLFIVGKSESQNRVFKKIYHLLNHYLTNLMHKVFFHNKFYLMPLHVSSTCARHQEVKIALHSLWYHHTYRWPCLYMFRAHVLETCRGK